MDTKDQSELSGDKDSIARRLMGDKTADRYFPPTRVYDHGLEATSEYIESLPDLQNGPSSLIQGSEVNIEQVGTHNFRLPIIFEVRSGGYITLETSVTGTVSLEAFKKGINMSRIMRSFYEFKDQNLSLDKVNHILHSYKKNLKTFDAKIMLNFSYPIMQKSLRSQQYGYQYYNVTLEGDLNKDDVFRKFMHFDFVYSSSCPCSFELSQHAVKYRGRAIVSHSQRSVARISVRYEDMLWIEDLHEMCLEALRTETQVMVKREDEQAFAELNGANLKFVEDSVRLLHEQLNKDGRIKDFKIVASHQESLHSHDAVGCIVKGIPGGFTPEVPREIWNSLIPVPR
jgi:GTP cyclohydrolase IB